MKRETVLTKLKAEGERLKCEVEQDPLKSVGLAFLLGVVLTTFPYIVCSIFLLAGAGLLALWYFGEHDQGVTKSADAASGVSEKRCDSEHPSLNGCAKPQSGEDLTQ